MMVAPLISEAMAERRSMKSLNLRVAILACLLVDPDLCSTASELTPSVPASKRQIRELYVPAPDKDGKWVPGLHYNVLIPDLPTYTVPGQVQLLELSMYTSLTRQDTDPYIRTWLEKYGNRINYIQRPAAAGFPHARLLARVFYTLEALGPKDYHDKFSDWVFGKDHWPVYHNVLKPDPDKVLALNLGFSRSIGVDALRFIELYNSPEVADKVVRAEISTHSFHVDGTPTFIVNYRYSASVQRLVEYPDGEIEEKHIFKLIALLDYLVSSELEVPTG